MKAIRKTMPETGASFEEVPVPEINRDEAVSYTHLTLPTKA